MSRKRAIGILFFVLCVLVTHAQIPFLKELQITRDGSSIKINRIYQDSQHFIWIGTSQGLFRYDGYNFQKIQGSDSTAHPSVNAIMRDTSGRLWIGYEDGAIRILQHNRLTKFQPEEGVPKVAITDFVQDSSGNIWFSTYGEGLYVLTQHHIYNFNTDDGITDNFVYSITVCKNGNVWCGTDEGLSICSWKNGKKSVERLSQAQGLPDNIVRSVQSDTCGKIWVGMQDKGLCYFDLDSDRFVVPSNLLHWDYGAVTCICLLRHNELWVGTEKSGITDVELFGAMRVRSCGRVSGMSANRINDLIQDAEGNMWIAANTALLFSPGEKLEFMHSVNGIPLTDIQSILYRKNGELWLSTPKDLWAINLNDQEGKTIRKVFENNQLGASSILCMYEDPYSNIWIGTFGRGVFYYESKSGVLQNIREANGLANDNVLSIAGKGNDVWFASLGGVSRCKLTGDHSYSALQTFTEENGLKENYVYNVFIDSKNRVWFGTDGKGITVYENNAFRNYSKEAGLKSNVIYSITEDSHGTIWFSTQDAGIYSFDGKNFHNYSLSEGLSETDISSIKADDNGNIIIVNDHGIDVMQTANHHFLYYGQESDISEIDPNLNASFKDDEGNIWIGTKSGIVKIRMPSKMVDERPFTVLNSVKIFLKDIDEKQKPVFSYKQNHVSFDYAGLYFSNPEKVIYEYKLDGYNQEWIKTHDRFITFPNLRPGAYNFHIRSALSNQFDNATMLSFPFTIKNPFWQEPWFYLFAFIVVVSAVYFFIKIREKNLRREEQLKKESIEFQFETLKSQINPHFLFNSFNTLSALIDEDRDVAITYVDNLSDFYRSILTYKDVDVISLKEEWQLTMNYVYLLKQRHGSAFNLIDEVKEKRQDLFLPPLTLQMLVENAVKHNVVSKERPLTIRLFMNNEETLVVENNLQPKSQQPISTKFGLRSISDRFEYLGGKPISIQQTFDQYRVELTLIKKLTPHESTHY
ncbi:MAG TPA: two-component regulator propeller domain-containing protein [Chitinophagales bacterium]|nr:two-component regulator propeller domain-containing protein [Chitinophagales bacterium]